MKFLPLLTVFFLISFSVSDASSWIRIKGKKTTLLVPSYMSVMTGLNEGADLAYGYVQKVDDIVLELYVITLYETKKEIKSYKLNFEFDALSYWELAAESLVEGLSDVEVVTKNLQIEQLNGKTRVQSEIKASFEGLNVVYNLAVYETKKSFYQVLTWTIDSQHEQFKEEMNSMVNSLEIK